MKIEGNKIIFKSIPEFWEKEYLNKKPYTIRLLNEKDCDLLLGLFGVCDKLLIEIQNTETKQSFTREIKDISQLGEFLGKYLIGIAWEIEENG